VSEQLDLKGGCPRYSEAFSDVLVFARFQFESEDSTDSEAEAEKKQRKLNCLTVACRAQAARRNA
jgi:hypothetical protein